MPHAFGIPPKNLTKPTVKRFQKGPKEILKGHKWGEFFTSQDLILDGELFKLRIGSFFRIPAVAIIHKRKYIVLRKISQKQWAAWHAKYMASQVGMFGSYGKKDHELSGDWYSINGSNHEWITGLPKERYVLEKSKFDLLRK